MMQDVTPMITIRSVKSRELTEVHRMIQSNVQEWTDVTLETIETYYELDPFGFKVALLSDGSTHRIIGVFFACNIGPQHGFGDIFVVSRDYRRRGIGARLLSEAVCHFGPRNWAVDAEVDAVSHFKKLGLQEGEKTQCYHGTPLLDKDYKIYTHQKFIVGGMVKMDDSKHSDARNSRLHKTCFRIGRRSKSQTNLTCIENIEYTRDKRANRRQSLDVPSECSNKIKSHVYKVVQERELDFSDIAKYDAKVHCISRATHLTSWFRYSGSHTYVCVDSNEKIVGYACARPVGDDEFEIGPLFADVSFVAKILMMKMIMLFEGRSLYLQVPLCNDDSVKIVKSLGLAPVGEPLIRLYSNQHINVQYKNVFVSHKFGYA